MVEEKKDPVFYFVPIQKKYFSIDHRNRVCSASKPCSKFTMGCLRFWTSLPLNMQQLIPKQN